MIARSRQPAIEVRDLKAGYDGRPVISSISWEVLDGTLAGIIGPNGGGKSTLLKALVGLVKPLNENAEIRLMGSAPGEVRGKVAYLSQAEEVDWSFPISVLDVVLQGRLISKRFWERFTPQDYELARQALTHLGISDLESAHIGSLSGGQRQRVFLARALAQGADIILLDEPATGLDAQAQHELASTFQKLRSEGRTIVVATHDFDCLIEHFDQVLALNGEVVAEGVPREVLTEDIMTKLFSRHFPTVQPTGEVMIHDV